MISVTIPTRNAQMNPSPFPTMGGANPSGVTLGVNSRYFTLNGEPVVPIMGEFQFSRYPREQWREELEKMRACGVDVIQCYIFWIHYEEIKGEWDFSGSRDIRAFLDECAAMNYPVALRVGPWCHGECRNGGLPDWIVKDKTLKPRTSDPAYLSFVKKLYAKIAQQTSGHMWKDGGPVVCVQVENEYCGRDHEYIRQLKDMAVEAGLVAPFYSLTAWGGAYILEDETLPTFGGYADTFWARHTHEMPACVHYLLTPFRDDSIIGSDQGIDVNSKLSFNPDKYPFVMAELGGGMNPSMHRRPVITGADTEALALCKIGIGVNLPGYYVFHGGTNPDGKLTTLQESKDSGYPNDMPVKSYDFEAPIRENGELNDSYRKLKRLHLFLKSFGETLAPAVCVLPDKTVSNPEDVENLRMSVRHNYDTGGGFLFINNHQRQRRMSDHLGVDIRIETLEGEIHFPMMDVLNGDYAILPYNLRLGSATLVSSNAQPLCRVGERYFFFSKNYPVYNWKDQAADVITLTPDEAENAWLFGDNLYITAADMRESDGRVIVSSCDEHVSIKKYGAAGEPVQLSVDFPRVDVPCNYKEATGAVDNSAATCSSSVITIGEIPVDSINEAYLCITYVGDRAELYINNKLAADWFTTDGKPWRVPLRRYGFAREYTLKIYPVVEEVYYEIPKPDRCALLAASVSVRRERLL